MKKILCFIGLHKYIYFYADFRELIVKCNYCNHEKKEWFIGKVVERKDIIINSKA